MNNVSDVYVSPVIPRSIPPVNAPATADSTTLFERISDQVVSVDWVDIPDSPARMNG